MAESGVGLRRRAGLWLGPGLCATFLVLPEPTGMPAEAWRTAAVAVWMASWWVTEAVPIPVTSLLPLPLFPILGILGSKATAAHYGHHLIFLFYGGFVLALALERRGLHRRLALTVLSWVGGSPRRILLGFMISCAFLSMWMSNTAATLVMLPIGTEAARQLARGARYEGRGGAQVEGRVLGEFGALLMLALAYSASAGGAGTLIGTPTNLAFAAAVREIFPGAPEIGFLRWMAFGLPLVVLFLAILWLYLGWWAPRLDLRRLRPGGSDRAAVRRELAALGPISPPERWTAAVFALAAAAWLGRTPVTAAGWPGWASWFPRPEHLHDSTVAMVAALLLMTLPVIVAESGRRGPVVDWKLVTARMPWGILLLFGGGLALAAGFESSGLARWIGGRLGAFAAVPPVVLVAGTCLLVTFLTELTSNTATVTMLMPVLAATARGAELHPLLLMLPAALSGSCAFMLPVATPPNAVVFGSGWIDIPRMARTGLWMNLIGVILVTLTVYWIAGPLLGLLGGGLPAWAR